KVVCVGGGFVYGSLGMSHHATEEMAILRALPGVTVFTPGDPEEVEAVVPVMLKTPGTCYLRLGRGGEPTLHDGPVTGWEAPRALTLREGSDVALLSAGGILTQTVSAGRMLAEKGVSAEIVSFPCLKPIDRDKLIELAGRFRHIVTVEEHSIVGGFGSAVCEVIAETGAPCRVHRIGMEDVYSCIVGTQQYLRGEYHMDDKAICERTLQWLEA
ncbi:MAG: transketolase, partial [Clostridia bacterium]|nr:transketolase [Clostridia bacterium]